MHSAVAEFTSTQITHKVPTTCNLGLTVANTLITDYLNTGTIRSNYFMGNGTPDVSLLGVNSASLSCTDVLGTSSVSSRCRTNQEGCLIATYTANADVCFQTPSGTRSIRLNGTTLSLGDLTSPALTLSNTAVSILTHTTVSNHLGCGTFCVGRERQHTM